MKWTWSGSAALLLLALAVLTTARALGQGSVFMQNTAVTRFLTNTVAFGGTSGVANRTNGPFYYQLLTAPSSITTVDLSLQDLLSGTWSDTGLQGTNSVFLGRETSGTNMTVNFWPIAQTNSFIVVGWTENLGTTWAQVSAELFGASLVPQNGGFMWEGGGFQLTSQPAFLGATAIGFRQAGGVIGADTFIPIPTLFATFADPQGNPVTTPTDLWVVGVPEPSVTALILIATISVLTRRRALAV